MTTECIASKLEFQELEGRRVEAEFNGGQITSDSGGLLLREVESRYGFISPDFSKTRKSSQLYVI